ncbi:MAG TPA: hypothetical protein VNH11_14565 [Pirellulales bacterium]|nr:hypothetical protein [Pirellulales bacterium]
MTLLMQAAALCDASEEESRQPPVKGRLEVMQMALGELRLASAEIKSPGRLRFGTRPLLRYNDPTRGLLDAAIWRLAEKGRPLALVTLELYESGPNGETLSYEFVSLAEDGFEMKSPRGPRWSPKTTELKLVPLSNAPLPATTGRARLAQFRKIAQRFSAHEKLEGNAVECRLLPQPIDRYSDADTGALDGAVFAFANGTNPEVGLLLECTEKVGSYGAFRLSSAEIVAALDGKPFFTAEQVNSLLAPVTASYRAARHRLAPGRPLPERK